MLWCLDSGCHCAASYPKSLHRHLSLIISGSVQSYMQHILLDFGAKLQVEAQAEVLYQRPMQLRPDD